MKRELKKLSDFITIRVNWKARWVHKTDPKPIIGKGTIFELHRKYVVVIDDADGFKKAIKYEFVRRIWEKRSAKR